MNPGQVDALRRARERVQKRMVSLSLFVLGAVLIGVSLGFGPHGSTEAAVRGALGLGGVFGAVYLIWAVPMFLYRRKLLRDEEEGILESASINVKACMRRSRDPRPFLVDSDKGRFEVEGGSVFDTLKKGHKYSILYTPHARVILKAREL